MIDLDAEIARTQQLIEGLHSIINEPGSTTEQIEAASSLLVAAEAMLAGLIEAKENGIIG